MNAQHLILNAVYYAGDFFSDDLKKHYDVRKVAHTRDLTHEELIDLIEDAEAIIASDERYTKRTFDVAKRLRIVLRYGVGIDNIDVIEATNRKIIVTNLPGANAQSVAEHTVGMMFALARRFPNVARDLRPNTWDQMGNECYGVKKPFELRGKTLGIIGLGEIGAKIAEISSALGMSILSFDPYVNNIKATNASVKLVDLTTLLSTSDIVTIHVPLTGETKHMISKDQLKIMKRSAIIINASRGAVVEESGLYAALKDGLIAAAGLDVLEKEPPDENNPLFTLANVMITPHYGGSSIETAMRSDAIVEEQIRNAFAGIIPRFVVNPAVVGLQKIRKQ